MDILQMNIYGSIIILIAVIIRAIAINKLPKRTFIVLWLIAIVRLTVPFTLPPVINVYPVVDRLNEISGDRLHIAEGYERLNTPPTADKADSTNVYNNSTKVTDKSGFTVPKYVIIWSIGLAVFTVLFVVPHVRSSRRYKSALPAENRYISGWRDAHPLRRKYKILVSDEISSAFTYGLLRPVIILPDNEDITGGRALDYVLTHEYIHIRRFDIALKWISALCACLNWFNPLVWVMYILLNRDIELSCDEGVLKSLGEDSRKSYAMLLLDMESSRISYNPIVNSFNKYAVRERVMSIMKNKKLGLINVALAFVLIVGSCAVLVSSCSKGEGEDTTINADTQSPETTQPMQSSDTTPQTTEDDRYANVRFGETKDILLLDIEWHTYETFLEYIEKEKTRAKETFKEFYSEDKVDEMYNEYVRQLNVEVENFKKGTIYVAKSINDLPEDQIGNQLFYNPNNNSDIYKYYDNIPTVHDVNEKNPDGYFIYHIYPMQISITYHNLKTNNLEWKMFNEINNGIVSSEDEYLYILDNEIKPFCDQKLADGEMSQEEYNFISTSNPRDNIIYSYFYNDIEKTQ